jgi:hypothetical protein
LTAAVDSPRIAGLMAQCLPTVLLTGLVLAFGCNNGADADGNTNSGGAGGTGGSSADGGTGSGGVDAGSVGGSGGETGGTAGTGGAGTGGTGAAGVCAGNRSIHDDADFDALVAESCQVIDGDLRVSGISYTSLDGLQDLTSVSNDLYIGENAGLESLSGLEDLTSVGRLDIVINGALTSLSGLEGLTSVDTLAIGVNGELTSLGPLHDWPSNTVSGGIEISFNARLPQCEVEAFDSAQVNAACTESSCSFNDDTATCS